MDPATVVLGGITISVVSGAIVKIFGNNKVKEATCVERRGSCTKLVSEKIDNLTKSIDELKDVVNDKLIGHKSVQ